MASIHFVARRSVGIIALSLVAMASLARCDSSARGSVVNGPGYNTASPSAEASPRAFISGTSPEISTSRPRRPQWATEPLTDVRTGATVRLADFEGSLVLVEAMATWCPPCISQQAQAQAALTGTSDRGVVYVSLDVDPREAQEAVARYADDHAFPWRFVVGSQAVLRSLAGTFGDPVLSPPNTPVVVIRRDGSAYLTEPGIKSAERLTQIIRAEP